MEHKNCMYTKTRLVGLHFTCEGSFFGLSSTNSSTGEARAILINCLAKQLLMMGKRNEMTITPLSFSSLSASSPVVSTTVCEELPGLRAQRPVRPAPSGLHALRPRARALSDPRTLPSQTGPKEANQASHLCSL